MKIYFDNSMKVARYDSIDIHLIYEYQDKDNNSNRYKVLMSNSKSPEVSATVTHVNDMLFLQMVNVDKTIEEGMKN